MGGKRAEVLRGKNRQGKAGALSVNPLFGFDFQRESGMGLWGKPQKPLAVS